MQPVSRTAFLARRKTPLFVYQLYNLYMISSHSTLFRLPLNLLFTEVFNYMAAMQYVTNRLNLTCRKMIMAFCNVRVQTLDGK